MKLDKNKTLEDQGFIKTSTGNYKKVGGKRRVYFYKESCEICNEPFLSNRRNGKFCCRTCSGKNKTMLGKKHSEETKAKIGRSGKDNPMYGKTGIESPTWKGGYRQKGVAFYDTFAPQLELYEEVRRNEQDPNVLEVKCFKCKEWYIPTLNNVKHKIQYLKGAEKYSENNFYCSNECKNSCSIFHKSPETLMKEDAVRAGRLPWLELTREVQPELRSMVLERDGNKCVKCESTNDLQCHHILPVNIEPLLSADVDNCITLCKECHIEVHKKDGCGYNQLKVEEC